MTTRLYLEGIAASLWGIPLVGFGLILFTSPGGSSSNKSHSPNLGAAIAIEVPVPKVKELIDQKEESKPTSPASNSSEPQRLDHLFERNPVEQTMQRAQELTQSQREQIVERYRTAQREGEFQLEIAGSDRSTLDQIGESVLVQTETTAKHYDKAGYPCPLSRNREAGLCVRLHSSQVPIRVIDAIRNDSEIRYSLQAKYQLILNSAIEIELYRSLYAFMQQNNLSAPVVGHRYQADLSITNGSTFVKWLDLGLAPAASSNR